MAYIGKTFVHFDFAKHYIGDALDSEFCGSVRIDGSTCAKLEWFLTQSSIQEVQDRDPSSLAVPYGVFRFRYFDVVFFVESVEGQDVELRSKEMNFSPYFYCGSEGLLLIKGRGWYSQFSQDPVFPQDAERVFFQRVSDYALVYYHEGPRHFALTDQDSFIEKGELRLVDILEPYYSHPGGQRVGESREEYEQRAGLSDDHE